MNNKALAIFGIVTYILSVYTSATNKEGEYIVADYIVLLSLPASILFAILATIRLWKINKFASTLYPISSIILTGLEALQVGYTSVYGSSIIIFFNIMKIITFLSFLWIIMLLWQKKQDKI